MISLAAMQGLGKPGSNIWSTTQGAPSDTSFMFPGYAEGGISGDVDNSAAGFRLVYRMFSYDRPTRSNINAPTGQHIPRLKIPECILDGKLRVEGQGLLRPVHRDTSSTSTNIRRTAIPRSRCTGATAAPSSAPCARQTAT